MRVSRAISISSFAGVLVCIGQSCVPTTPQPNGPPADEPSGDNGAVPATGAPKIAAVPDHNAHAGQAYNLPCRLVSETPTTWSLDDYMAMNGMAIDSAGRITWTTPTDVSDHRNFDITVTAANSAGASEMKYRLTVYEGSNSPPTVIQPTARAEPVTRTEASVTLSCDVYDAESDSQTVIASLTGLGAAPVSLVQQGSAELGYHYAWQGRVTVPTVIGTGAVWEIGDSDGPLYHDGELTLSPAGAAGLETVQVSSDRIAGAGGTLVYQGHEITGTLQVPTNALMGVVTAAGETYLYHPALGDAALTSFTSRQAVGAFINGLSPETMPSVSAKAASHVDPTLAADGASSCTLTALNTNVTTTTGAKVYAMDGSSGVTSTISNPTKRWMAIQSQSGDGPYFLAPASRGELATDVLGLLQQIAQGRQISSTEKTIAGEPVEIYGALARAMPFLLAPPDLPLHWLPDSLRRIIEPYVPWGSYQGQSYYTTLTALAEKGAAARTQDMALFLRLNMVDLGHLLFEGLKSVLGFIPEECSEAIVKALTANVGETLWVGLFTFESDAFLEFLKGSMKELGSDAILCGGEVLTGPVAAVFANLLDIIAGFAWIKDWNLGRDDAMQYQAFECVRFQPEEPPPEPEPEPEPTPGPLCESDCSQDCPIPEGAEVWESNFGAGPVQAGYSTATVWAVGPQCAWADPTKAIVTAHSCYDENGLQHGLSCTWSNSGVPLTRIGREHGVLHGPYLTFHDNGQPKLESTYTDGELDGVEWYYYEDGTPQSETHYSIGVRNGDLRRWFENGQMEIETHFDNGVENGRYRNWNEDGSLKADCDIVNDEFAFCRV